MSPLLSTNDGISSSGCLTGNAEMQKQPPQFSERRDDTGDTMPANFNSLGPLT